MAIARLESWTSILISGCCTTAELFHPSCPLSRVPFLPCYTSEYFCTISSGIVLDKLDEYV
jgi:hypothetical protein